MRDTLRARQFATESFAQNLLLDSLAFPVRRGDVIGFVGNRGHSFGSHLHFELREAATDKALNPMVLGLPIPDTRAPQIRNVRVYELDADDYVLATTTASARSAAGVYSLPDTFFVAAETVALGLKAYDRQDGRPNWNGVYQLDVWLDSTLVFRQRMDTIGFDRTTDINVLTDYRDWTENESWYYRMWARPRVRTEVVKSKGGKWRTGLLRLKANRPVTVSLEVADFAGNRSAVPVTILRLPNFEENLRARRGLREAEPTAGGERELRISPLANDPRAAGYIRRTWSADRPHQYYLPADEASVIDNGHFRLELAADALYRPLYFRYDRLPDASAGHLSDTHVLHDDSEPFFGNATLTLRPRTPVPDSLRERVYVAKCGDFGEFFALRTEVVGDGFVARPGRFGSYALLVDTIPPTVEIRRFATDQRRSAGFSLLIGDNIDGGGMTWRGTVDGAWVLLEHDAKNRRLNFAFADHDIPPGEHLFELELTDGRGNVSVFRRRFRR